MKIKCSATLIAALLTAISVFCANVAHTEYKSQVKKSRSRRTQRHERQRHELTVTPTTGEPLNVQLL